MFLAAGQVFLKLAFAGMGEFVWTRKFFVALLTNRHLAASGISMLMASLIWFYIIKHYELSLAYPLTSMSYIFGTLAAIFIFNESVPAIRWIGVVFIMLGVAILSRPAA
jgi:undecaprenyl phosphate-alpha-L-ara4N flippase subunit ArnE